MSGRIWIGRRTVEALHDRQLAEHGGMSGLRDEGLLESALARPLNLDGYGEPDACDLAASYTFGLVRNHAFVDGNKRTGWIVGRLFLEANGFEIVVSQQDIIATVLALASGDLGEDALADWYREHLANRASPV